MCAGDLKYLSPSGRMPIRLLVAAAHVSAFTSFVTAASRARTATLFLFSVAVLLAGGAAALHGQSVLDGFDPNANGFVTSVVVQPDGKILLGGDFTTLAPNGGASVTRNRIARLNPDGTLDTAFNPNANAIVRSIAVQADGKILAGGSFTAIGGQPRNRIARLDAVTGLADSWDPNASNAVYTVALQTDGKILVGGFFTSIGGQTRNRIARLDAVTGLADSFDPDANSGISSIAVQTDGKILVTGLFSGANSIGGQTRNYITRLDATTGLADSWDPNADNQVGPIAVQADGKIIVSGFFGTIGGQSRAYIARLDAITGSADSFNPQPLGGGITSVNAIAVQTDGKILVGGDFGTIGGQTRSRIARLDATTGLADSFNPNVSGGSFPAVYAMAVQPDGKVLAGGDFTSIGGETRNRIARLETDGRLDRTLSLGAVGTRVFATAVQPDGKTLIGGDFTSVLGTARNRIARLNADGTLDTNFNPNANETVNSIVVQADGKILAGGSFSGANSIGGQARNYIARLDPSTGLADSFNPNANGTVYTIAVQADGKILVGGGFNGGISIGGQTRNHIARLDPTSGMADSFNPNANNIVGSIAVQGDGKILAGGSFNGANSIGGQTRNSIARLNATTGLADSFDPNANSTVFAIVAQADGKILAGGLFTSIGGHTRNRIARLDATSGLTDSFDPNSNGTINSLALQADGKILAGGSFSGANSIGGQTRNRIARLDAVTGLADSFDPNADSTVYTILMRADGKILAGGDFFSVGGQGRNLFVRLSNDTAALQNLSATRTTATWTRGGSSPQFTRVTFEDSTDNVNYNFLGNGTATGTNWTLTGLNFSIQQNLYIRARGYYRSGYQNGSESLTESVRNAFIVAGPNISGTISYCSNPVPGPVPNVTLTLTGSAPGSTLSDGSGNYQFSSLISGGSYTVTPAKSALPPGPLNITGVDAIAVQRHFLNLGTPLSGCRLAAADVTGTNGVDGVDAVAIQRFFLGFTSGIANVGKYQFNPALRTYSAITSNQTGQNYDTLVFGDVASGFVHRSEGGDDRTSSGELISTVARVALPAVAVDPSVSDFVAAVKTTTINGDEKLIGFQGDFTFDERVVTFQTEPVRNAGLTEGNWNVSGNVLPGTGPIRTLRISAYSNDFTPLSGSGTLFELGMTRGSEVAPSTPLLWAAPPDEFIFVDADLKTQKPGYAGSGSVTQSGKRK